MTRSSGEGAEPLGLIWVACPDLDLVVTAGLVRALEERARVHIGSKPPEDVPSCIVLCSNGQGNVSERVERYRKSNQGTALPLLLFDSHLDLPLARDALRAGASGYIHAGMTLQQLLRAVELAIKGELVAPRSLIPFLLIEDKSANLDGLSRRQREILGYVVEGLSNAEIGKRLFLSESTIKQHLRSAYKLLGVHNRTEAANLIRREV